MKFKVFSIYDSAAETFNTPVFLATNNQAIRQFDDMVNGDDSQLAKHPGDYTLFCIGEFDTDIGLLTPLDKPSSLGKAEDFQRQD